MGNQSSLEGHASRVHELLLTSRLDKETIVTLEAIFNENLEKKQHNKKGSRRSRSLSITRRTTPELEDIELSKEDFCQVMEKSKIAHGEVVSRLFDLFDSDGSGGISLTEWIASLEVLLKGSDAEKLAFIFGAYDVDGGGSLTADELENMAAQMKAVYQSRGLSVKGIEADQVIDGFIESLDEDGDGEVTLDEFTSAGLKMPKLIPLLLSPVGWEDALNSAEQITAFELRRRLTNACRRTDDVLTVREILENESFHVNLSNKHGQTLLYFAAKRSRNVTKYLLEARADPTISDVFGVLPLHRAAEGGSLACIRQLLDYDGEDMQGRRAIHYAARWGHMEALKVLIEHDSSSVEAQTSMQETPLHMAAAAGHSDVIKALVQWHQANVEGAGPPTPLLYSCMGGHVEACETLLLLGANLQTRDVLGNTMLHLCTNSPTEHHAAVGIFDLVLRQGGEDLLKSRNEMLQIPLHCAAATVGCSNLCEVLAKEYPAGLRARDENGRTPFDVAVDSATRTALMKVAALSMSPTTLDALEKLRQGTAVQPEELAAMLTHDGVDMSVSDLYGKTIVDYVMKSNNEELVAVLLRDGRPQNVPLEFTLKNCGVDIVRAVLHYSQQSPQNCLLWAAQASNTSVLDVLLDEFGAKLTATPPLLSHQCGCDVMFLKVLFERQPEFLSDRTLLRSVCGSSDATKDKLQALFDEYPQLKEFPMSSALESAAAVCFDTPPLELFQFLVDHGAQLGRSICAASCAGLPENVLALRQMGAHFPLEIYNPFESFFSLEHDEVTSMASPLPVLSATSKYGYVKYVLLTCGNDFDDSTARRHFFVLYRTLFSPQELFDLVMTEYNRKSDEYFEEESSDDDSSGIVLNVEMESNEAEDEGENAIPDISAVHSQTISITGDHVVKFVECWLTEAPYDFVAPRAHGFPVPSEPSPASRHKLKAAMDRFLDTLDFDVSERLHLLLIPALSFDYAMAADLSRRVRSSTVVVVATDAASASVEQAADVRMRLDHMSPDNVAQQLCLISKVYWDSLSLYEFYECRFSKKDPSLSAPNVTSFIAHFNKLSNFTKHVILDIEKPKERARMIGRFIQIAQNCITLFDFSDAMAILAALQSTTLERLKQTWPLCNPELIAKYEALKELTHPRGNYKNLRTMIDPDVPQIPFIGLLMGDLIHADEISAVAGQALPLNAFKLEVIGNALSAIVRSQRLQYNFNADLRFQEWFRTFEVMDADTARNLSRTLEPPEDVQNQLRRSPFVKKK